MCGGIAKQFLGNSEGFVATELFCDASIFLCFFIGEVIRCHGIVSRCLYIFMLFYRREGFVRHGIILDKPPYYQSVVPVLQFPTVISVPQL